MSEAKQKLVDGIITVIHKKNGSPVSYDKAEAVCVDPNKPWWALSLDGNIVTTKKNYRIQYHCPTCQVRHSVCYSQFGPKLNSEHPETCTFCREIKTEQTPLDEERYYRNYMNEEDMARIRPYIFALRNGNVTKEVIEQCVYHSKYPSATPPYVTPVFFQPETKEVITLEQPVLLCPGCNGTWRVKTLTAMRHRKTMFCDFCRVPPKKFPQYDLTNIQGENVHCDGRPQKRIVEWCNERNVLVQQGPKITYMHANQERTYQIPLYIPQIQYYIDFPPSHKWHGHELHCKMWDSKMAAVKEQLPEYTHMCMTPQTRRKCYQELRKLLQVPK